MIGCTIWQNSVLVDADMLCAWIRTKSQRNSRPSVSFMSRRRIHVGYRSTYEREPNPIWIDRISVSTPPWKDQIRVTLRQTKNLTWVTWMQLVTFFVLEEWLRVRVLYQDNLLFCLRQSSLLEWPDLSKTNISGIFFKFYLLFKKKKKKTAGFCYGLTGSKNSQLRHQKLTFKLWEKTPNFNFWLTCEEKKSQFGETSTNELP